MEPELTLRGCKDMHSAKYYRKQAEHAQKLADLSPAGAFHEAMERIVEDYNDVAEDLETGAVEIRHPEMLPQRNRDRNVVD